MAKTPDGRGVLLFGGQNNQSYHEDRILELQAGADYWTISDIALQHGKFYHTVIPLQ